MIVSNLRTLKAMARKGHIKLHEETGQKVRHWTGRTVTACYVDGKETGDRWYEPFEYKGTKYRLQYFDGCFCPFVCTVDTPRGGFV